MTHEEIIAMAREEGLSFVPDSNSPLARIVRRAVAKEREACAQLCDSAYYQFIGPEFGEVRHGIAACAAAIRARGQKEELV